MADKVREYKERRYKRLLSRMDDNEKGSWITTENGHKVHLNENGEPDKGNPHVIDKMTGGSSGGAGYDPSKPLSQTNKVEVSKLIGEAKECIKDLKSTLNKSSSIPKEFSDALKGRLHALPNGTRITVERGEPYVKNEKGYWERPSFGDVLSNYEMSEKCCLSIRDYGTNISISEGVNKIAPITKEKKEKKKNPPISAEDILRQNGGVWM